MLAFKCEKKAITVLVSLKLNKHKGHCITMILGKLGPESATQPQRLGRKPSRGSALLMEGSKTKKDT